MRTTDSARPARLRATGAHARRKLVEVEGLHEVIVGAGVEPRHAIGHCIARGDDEHRDRRGFRTPRLEQRKPVAARKSQVEQHDVIGRGCDRRVGVATIAYPIDGVAFLAQALAGGLADHGIVFD
jgi:hypothetical protein